MHAATTRARRRCVGEDKSRRTIATVTRYAQKERRELATLLGDVGEEAPTLCEGWNTYDLAAHLVARERRLDAGPGLLLPAAAGYTDAVRKRVRATHEYRELVELIRSGPPIWNPMRIEAIDEAVNIVEFFVHHEDVRRAQSSWTPRDLERDMEQAIWKQLRRFAPRLVKAAPCGVMLQAAGIDELVVSDVPETTPRPANELIAKQGSPGVTISGLPSELALYCYGRAGAARVQQLGDESTLAALRGANLGY